MYGFLFKRTRNCGRSEAPKISPESFLPRVLLKAGSDWMDPGLLAADLGVVGASLVWAGVPMFPTRELDTIPR